MKKFYYFSIQKQTKIYYNKTQVNKHKNEQTGEF